LSASPYQSLVWRDSCLVWEITDVSSADSCILCLDHIANTRTRPLRPYDSKPRLPVFHTAADFPQQIPMQVAFFWSFKPFSTYTAADCHYPKTCVTIWCACYTLMPSCSLISRCMTWWSHCTVWST
jgi:hypothetical protein